MLAFGAVMVYSASSYNAEMYYGGRYFFLFKQLAGIGGGIAAMVVMTIVDYRRLHRLRFIVLGISALLLGLVLIPGIGMENYGARR